MKKLKKILKQIPDPRQSWKIKHSLAEILLICILAVTANANSSYEIHTFAVVHELWLRRFMALEKGIPSRLTFERVLRLLNPKHFNVVSPNPVQNICTSTTERLIRGMDGSKKGSIICFTTSHGLPIWRNGKTSALCSW